MPHSKVDESVAVNAENAAIDIALALLKASLPEDIAGADAMEALETADEPTDLAATELAHLREKYFILAGATKYFILAGATKYIQDLEHRRNQLRQETQGLQIELYHWRGRACPKKGDVIGVEVSS